MNYIRHLNAFFIAIKKDDRLTSSHVSLYLALFQYWNYNRFQNPFPIYRDNIMQLSKIGSKNTYHKCMKELDKFSYLIYHTAVIKYQPVKISIIRLDIKQPTTSYQQLDLFNSSPKTGTQSVSIMTDTSTDNDTVQVPISGHTLKPNILKTESNRHSQKSEEEKKKRGRNKADSPGVPNSVHSQNFTLGHSKGEASQERQIPNIEDVKSYFAQSNHSSIEAEKFYNHYKALGWKITGQPIENWQALANKWMLNATGNKKNNSRSVSPQDLTKEIEYLSQRHSEGSHIINEITVEHFYHLNLELTDEIKTLALKERISHLVGSNQYSINQLLQAYQRGDSDNQLIIKDQPNLILVAQKLAVLSYFHYNLKSRTKSRD